MPDVADYIVAFNKNVRLHAKLGQLSPTAYERATAAKQRIVLSEVVYNEGSTPSYDGLNSPLLTHRGKAILSMGQNPPFHPIVRWVRCRSSDPSLRARGDGSRGGF